MKNIVILGAGTGGTFKEDDTVSRAIQVMDRNRIKRLVIIDPEHHVRGIISRPDPMSLYLAR